MNIKELIWPEYIQRVSFIGMFKFIELNTNGFLEIKRGIWYLKLSDMVEYMGKEKGFKITQTWQKASGKSKFYYFINRIPNLGNCPFTASNHKNEHFPIERGNA